MKDYLNNCQILVMGNTNAGKSTFLNNLIGCGAILNTSEMRETSCVWKIKFHSSENFCLKAEFYSMDVDKKFQFFQVQNLIDLKR